MRWLPDQAESLRCGSHGGSSPSAADGVSHAGDGAASAGTAVNGGETTLGGIGYRYGDTKLQGDRHLRAFLERLEIVWIHPGAMLGPFDFTLQYGRLFADLREGRVPAVPRGGTSWAHVVDVARAHVGAAGHGEPGASYLCAGVNASYREMFTHMASSWGEPAPACRPGKGPRRLRTPPAGVGGAEPPTAQLDPGYARFVSRHGAYDSSRAVRELGYVIPPLEQMVTDAHDWYVAHGLL